MDISKSYFEWFDLPESFEVNLELLTERYLALQRIVHPDAYANASDQERRLAIQKSALLNEAMRVLKDPLARANYLLTRHRLPIESRPKPTNDPIFLAEQMQIRESIEEAQAQPNSHLAIATILEQLLEQHKSLLQSLAYQLEVGNWLEAQELLYKLQFVEKVQRSIEA